MERQGWKSLHFKDNEAMKMQAQLQRMKMVNF